MEVDSPFRAFCMTPIMVVRVAMVQVGSMRMTVRPRRMNVPMLVPFRRLGRGRGVRMCMMAVVMAMPMRVFLGFVMMFMFV